MATIDPQTILNESKIYADSLKSEVLEAIERLESYSTGFQTWVDFPTTIYPSPEKVGHVPTEALPVLEKTVFGSDLNDPYGDIEKYKTHIFVASALDDMQTKLGEWINNGGVGISTDVQEALWQNGREQDLQNLTDGLAAAASTDAKRGFSYSTKRRASSIVIANHMITRDNRSWEITSKIAELAQQNVQNAVQQNIAIEQLHSSFSLGLSGIFQQFKNRIIEKYRLELDARQAEYKSKVDAIIEGYKQAASNANLDISYQELLARTSSDNLKVHTERTKTLIQQATIASERQLKAMDSAIDALGKQLSAALLQTNGISVHTVSG